MIEIIPAIDVIEGKCVRLKQGDFSQKTIYNENPLNVAKDFEAHGLKCLHIVDLDGAKIGKVTNLKVLEEIAAKTNLMIDFGGGIKTDEDIKSVFDAGAKMASIGSVAVKEPEKFDKWLDKYGSDKILLGADVKDGKVAINGWQTTTELEILPFLKKYYAKGVQKVFVTDISKDGLLQGSAKELYRDILEHLPRLQLIASGGIDSTEEIAELEKIGCFGAIIGKAIYEDRISLTELSSGQFASEGRN
ncbi:MAG: 1-(5-phosphoribosyl)-5-[(5-phosphoribosylamino)methylideneamino]imidazole-4-carboxamide isomerase [Aridibacter sp.]